MSVEDSSKQADDFPGNASIDLDFVEIICSPGRSCSHSNEMIPPADETVAFAGLYLACCVVHALKVDRSDTERYPAQRAAVAAYRPALNPHRWKLRGVNRRDPDVGLSACGDEG
jgi:hypothetical protein